MFFENLKFILCAILLVSFILGFIHSTSKVSIEYCLLPVCGDPEITNQVKKYTPYSAPFIIIIIIIYYYYYYYYFVLFVS